MSVGRYSLETLGPRRMLTQKSLSDDTSFSNRIFLGSWRSSGFPVTQPQTLFNTDTMTSREPNCKAVADQHQPPVTEFDGRETRPTG